MRGSLKWLLAAAVVVAVLAMLGTPSAEAARWHVYAYGYPAYWGPSVSYYPGSYYYGPYWAPPPPVAVYPAPVIVRRPFIGPVYRPLYAPYVARPYWWW
jgi:hypothetical protein